MEKDNIYDEQFRTMDERLLEMEEKIDSIDIKLTQVVEAILGNPLTKQGGFIAEIDYLKNQIKKLEDRNIKLEEKQAEHDKFRHRVYWTIGTIVGVALVFKFFTTIYANLVQ